MPSQRPHLVVLFGGRSAEHDVSCTTAAHVLRAADPNRYRITAIGIDRDGQWHLAEDAMRALAAGPDALPGRLVPTGPAAGPQIITATRSTNPDTAAPETTVVLPLLHGPLGEDGTVQGMLELLDVPYVGSGVLASAVSMDKAMAKDVLARHGIAQARWRAVRDDGHSPSLAASLVSELGLPLFVKPANMGSSVGVSKAKTVDEVEAALHLAFGYDEWAVVEEAMPQEAAETDGPCAIPRALHPQVERIQRFHRRKGTRCGMLAG